MKQVSRSVPEPRVRICHFRCNTSSLLISCAAAIVMVVTARSGSLALSTPLATKAAQLATLTIDERDDPGSARDWQLIGFRVALLVATALIVILLRANAERKRVERQTAEELAAEREVREEQQRTREAEKQLEQRKSAVLDAMPARLLVLDSQGNIVSIYGALKASSFAGTSDSPVQPGSNFVELWKKAANTFDDHSHAVVRGMQAVLSRKSDGFGTVYVRGAAPDQRCWQICVSPLKSEDGGAVVAEFELRGRGAGKEPEGEAGVPDDVSGKLLRAQEEEKTVLARELHDDINQKLGLLAIRIQTLQQRAPGKPGEIHAELAELFRATNRISLEVQRISHRLHSSRLDYLGVSAALRRLCEDFETQHEIRTECMIRDIPVNLPRDVSLCLFRVAQECLSNVARHSRAQHVKVKLEWAGGNIRLNVSDDGSGFEVAELDARQGPGLGLVSMRERLRFIKGQLSIRSKPGRGTEIAAVVPWVVQENLRVGKPA